MTMRLIPTGVEENQFKRIPEGWLFTTANPWIVGSRPTYIVSDAQKPAVAAGVRRARYLGVVLSLVMAMLQASVYFTVPSLLDSRSLAAWLELGGFVIVFMIAGAICNGLIMRPLLRDLPRTSQKMSQVDKLRSQSEAMSIRALSILTLLLALAAAANILITFTASNASLFAAVGAILCAAAALVFFGMLIAKLRATTE